jgi:formate/nitrite transporter FocA (FNT family)
MGFSHIIAGTVGCAYLVERGGSNVEQFRGALLGNIVGGVALVAALNYGQVAPEINQK